MCLPTGRPESVSEAISFCWKKLPIPLKKKTPQSALTCHVRHLWDIATCVVALPLLDPIGTWTHLYHLKCHAESSTNDLVTSRNIRFTKDRKTFLIISGSTGYRKELGVGGQWIFHGTELKGTILGRGSFSCDFKTNIVETMGDLPFGSRQACSEVRSYSVQSLSRVWLFATPWIAARQASLSITNSQSLLKLMPIESVMPYSHLILCHSLLLLPSIPPSIRVFSNESTLLLRWPKYWSFSFSISPYSGLIAFRMDWLDLLAVQGTLKSLLLHHSSKASIFRRSAFFTIPLSHPYFVTHILADVCDLTISQSMLK